VNGVVVQRGAKGVHAIPPIAGMRGTDALPAIRRWANVSIRANRSGVGMRLQKAGVVHRIELGKDLRALAFEQAHALGSEATGTHPDPVPTVVAERLSLREPFVRNAAVKTAHRDIHRIRHDWLLKKAISPAGQVQNVPVSVAFRQASFGRKMQENERDNS